MAAKKLSQQDLRQLMRERKATPATAKARVDSPLARYDASGGLQCALCEVGVRDESQWSSHIVGALHKNKLEQIRLKKLRDKQKEDTLNRLRAESSAANREQTVKATVKRKIDSDSGSQQIKPKAIKLNVETLDKSKDNKVAKNETSSTLPSDFFDETIGKSENLNNSTKTKDSEMKSESTDNSLPKGFFDDPMMDAKARHVVYKDPIDEEWEKFQKVIAEETTASETIIEDDMEEVQVDRSILEIEEQISNWTKVDEMQKKAEELHLNSADKCLNDSAKDELNSDDSDINDEEVNVFANWRSKRAIHLR